MQEKERGAQDKAVVAEFMLRVAQFPAPVQSPIFVLVVSSRAHVQDAESRPCASIAHFL